MDWLLQQSDGLQSRSQGVGMWQVLVDEGILVHGENHLILAEALIFLTLTSRLSQKISSLLESAVLVSAEGFDLHWTLSSWKRALQEHQCFVIK